jgi:hypothetical protein
MKPETSDKAQQAAKPRMREPTDNEILDKLGGSHAVARIFEIRGPSVSDWRKYGIPKARRMYLQVVYPHVFEHVPVRRKRA